jgi:outer membrane biosynthesis protein TonB
MTSRKKTALAALAVAAALAASWFFLDPRYYPASELDRKPYPMQRIDLDFPPAAGGVEYFGKLRVNVYIGRDGAVDRVELLSSAVPAHFSEAAVRALRESRWEPGRSGPRRVRSVKTYEIDFEPPVPGLGRTLTAPGQ